MATRDWDSTFSQWARPPSKTERTRCDNAVKIIRNAIESHQTLGAELRRGLIMLFLQGSYRNRVNVRADSDVDVGVLYTGSFFARYPAGYSRASFGHGQATYTYSEFKGDLERALIDYLGAAAIQRGNKSIKLRETSYHVEADVAPFFEHQWYFDPHRDPFPGVELRPDNDPSERVINYPEALFSGWPKEHYENGRDKNDTTRRRYRGTVRILKKLRNEMEDSGCSVAKPIPGYLLECLVWNTPNSRFEKYQWDDRVQAVLVYLWSNTKDRDSCGTWREVDGIKYLFHVSQAWNLTQAHTFIDAAWDYVGFRGS